MRMHSVALRFSLRFCQNRRLKRDDHAFFADGGNDMAKIQIIAAMTIDGYLPTADNNLMQWVASDAKGFPYWHERSIYRLQPHYPLLDLLAKQHSDKNKSDIYIAEISDKDSIELLRGLSLYNLIDEMVIYILPVILGKGTPVFDDLTPSRWSVHKTTTFSNGVTRIIYRNSCILQ